MTDSSVSRFRRIIGRRRFAPTAIVAGVVASAAIATSMTGALGAFTASIQNTVNNTATGVLTMQEANSGGTVTCNSTDANPSSNTINTNAATCSTINKYGGSTVLVPGNTTSTSITIKNTGTVAANTFTLLPTACTQGTNGSVNGSATNLCAMLSLTLTETITTAGSTSAATTPINGVALSALSTTTPGYTMTGPIPAGSTANFTFALTFSSSAGNTYQGLSASQQLTWSFTS